MLHCQEVKERRQTSKELPEEASIENEAKEGEWGGSDLKSKGRKSIGEEGIIGHESC